MLVFCALALLFTDWLQTRWIATTGQTTPHPDGGFYRETNPILGPSPSLLRVDAWFVAWLALTALVSGLAPWWLALGFNVVVIAFEIYHVVSNFLHGVQCRGFFS